MASSDNGVTSFEAEFVELDPTGRYGRYNEILGKGASKTVYRAFDEYEGIEVAWNQVKLHDFLQSPEDLERLYCEIHLLKTLKHRNIMKFYTSWVDTVNRNINFVTEMFMSGTLRQYRLKHKRVNIRAVKNWCRQILSGLLYLHSCNPPVIHRDLKCDNIFVNGNQGEVKIGDLGLAAILRKSFVDSCVGTPEFMAPEVYEEVYNELVDIYAFGMCVLEMVTFEYPYSECTHPAQIYKKVVSGKKPEAFYKVKDPEVRQFVEKCLASISDRLTAWELLNDPFLEIDDCVLGLRPIESESEPLLKQPTYRTREEIRLLAANYSGYELESVYQYQSDEFDLFASQEDEPLGDVGVSINDRKRDDDGVFLRLRIADKEGRIRNIYFPFDIDNDTSISVATEMISELDLTDQDVTKISEMIDDEIASLVPDWKRRQLQQPIVENTPPAISFCLNCALHSHLTDHISSNSPGSENLHVLQCSNQGCASVHGRFEEITYQVDGEEQCVNAGTRVPPCRANSFHFTDIWAQRDEQILSKEEKILNIDEFNTQKSFSISSAEGLVDDHENKIRQELRWLKAKYQLQLRKLRAETESLMLASNPDNMEQRKDHRLPPINPKKQLINSLSFKNYCITIDSEIENRKCDASCGSEPIFTAKSFYSLHKKATSLPVDAVDT